MNIFNCVNVFRLLKKRALLSVKIPWINNGEERKHSRNISIRYNVYLTWMHRVAHSSSALYGRAVFLYNAYILQYCTWEKLCLLYVLIGMHQWDVFSPYTFSDVWTHVFGRNRVTIQYRCSFLKSSSLFRSDWNKCMCRVILYVTTHHFLNVGFANCIVRMHQPHNERQTWAA